MTIALVTGASGFLGKYVCDCLKADGSKVVRLARGDTPRSGADLVVVPREYRKASAIAEVIDEVQPDVIYHLAGTSQSNDLAELYDANVFYAEGILRAALLSHVRPRILFVGSAAEYGVPTDPRGFVSESDFCNPVSAYGISKLAQTFHGLAAARQGLHVTIARLFNPIGVGSPHTSALGSFVRQVAEIDKVGTLVTGDLNTVRDFIDIVDAARIIVKLPFSASEPGMVFNVCTGTGIPVNHLVGRLLVLSGVDVAHKVDPARGGTSDVNIVVGSATRLQKIGMEVASIDLDRILVSMLEAERARIRGSRT